jgi:hypothetical protein
MFIQENLLSSMLEGRKEEKKEGKKEGRKEKGKEIQIPNSSLRLTDAQYFTKSRIKA